MAVRAAHLAASRLLQQDTEHSASWLSVGPFDGSVDRGCARAATEEVVKKSRVIVDARLFTLRSRHNTPQFQRALRGILICLLRIIPTMLARRAYAVASAAAARAALALRHAYSPSVRGPQRQRPQAARASAASLTDCRLRAGEALCRAHAHTSYAAHTLSTHFVPPACRSAQRLRLRACSAGTRCFPRLPRCRPALRCVWACARRQMAA